MVKTDDVSDEEDEVIVDFSRKGLDKRAFAEVKAKFLARQDKIDSLEGKLHLINEQHKLRSEEVSYLRNRNTAKVEEVKYYKSFGGTSGDIGSDNDDDLEEIFDALNIFEQADKLQSDLSNSLAVGTKMEPKDVEEFFSSVAETAPFQANVDNLAANRELLPEIKDMIRTLVGLNRKIREDEQQVKQAHHYDPSQALRKLRDYVIVRYQGQTGKFRVLQRMTVQDLIDVACKFFDITFTDLLLAHHISTGNVRKFALTRDDPVKTMLYQLGGSVDYQPELEFVTEEEALGEDERKSEEEKKNILRADVLLGNIEGSDLGVAAAAEKKAAAEAAAAHEQVNIERLLAKTKYNAALEEKWKHDLLDSKKERVHLARVFANELRNQGKNRRSDYQSLFVHICWIVCAIVSIGWRRNVEEALAITAAYNSLLIDQQYPHGYVDYLATSAENQNCGEIWDSDSVDYGAGWSGKYEFCRHTGTGTIEVEEIYKSWVWGPFRSITETFSLEHVFMYLHDVLMPQIFPLGIADYNNYYGSYTLSTTSANRFYLASYNQLVAGVRLRQLRVKANSCTIDSEFVSVSDECYGDYEVSGVLNKYMFSKFSPTSTAEQTSYSPTVDTAACGTDHTLHVGVLAWCAGFYYRTAEELGSSSPTPGDGVTYDDGSGYVVDILIDRTVSQVAMSARAMDQIYILAYNGWLGAPTRALYVNWVSYSHVYNYFSVCQLVFYHTPGGEVSTLYNFKNIKLDAVNERPESIAYFVFYCLHLIFVTHNLVKFVMLVWTHFRESDETSTIIYGDDEGQKAKPSKIVTFMSDVWNIIFTFMITLYFMGFICQLMTWFRNESWEFDLSTTSFVDLEDVARGYNYGYYFDGLGLAVGILYSFRYLKSTARYFLIFSTLGKASYDLAVFLVIFAIAFLGFVFWANISFGPAIAQFRTIQESLAELSLMIVGQFRFDEMLEVNEFMAITFFMAYMLFIFFILTNIFLAILADAFIKAKVDERFGEMKEQFIKAELNIDYSTLAILKGIAVENTRKLTTLWQNITERRAKFIKAKAKKKKLRDEQMTDINEEKRKRKDRVQRAKQAMKIQKAKKAGGTRDDDDDDDK